MPTTRSAQVRPAFLEFSWQGRLYAIRVIFTTLVLVMVAISDGLCRNQPGAHFWLIISGAAYPHIGHLLLGRFEGKRRKGHAILVIDGLFSGAVMAAIGITSPPSVVLAAMNLFNWMVVGGPTLVAIGMMASLAGIAFSGMPDMSPLPISCMSLNAFAGVMLISYFLVLGRFIHHHMGRMRQQQSEFQTEADVAIRARRMADQSLLSILPRSAAEVLATRGELPPESLDDATVLLIGFSWERSQPPSISDLTSCFQISDAVIGRHGFECIKTFGRHYLALSRMASGPEDAISAVREVNNYLLDHKSLPGSPAGHPSLRAYVHCGPIATGLVQPSRLNFEILGEPVQALEDMAASCTDLPTGTVASSAAAQRRMANKSDFEATPAGQDGTIYLLRLTTSP